MGLYFAPEDYLATRVGGQNQYGLAARDRRVSVTDEELPVQTDDEFTSQLAVGHTCVCPSWELRCQRLQNFAELCMFSLGQDGCLSDSRPSPSDAIELHINGHVYEPETTQIFRYRTGLPWFCKYTGPGEAPGLLGEAVVDLGKATFL